MGIELEKGRDEEEGEPQGENGDCPPQPCKSRHLLVAPETHQ